MRIKNKEIRSRRQRKEQKIKDAARELRAKFGDGKAAIADKPTAPKKTAPKSAAKAAPKKTAEKPAAPKKPAASKAKKALPKEE